MSTFTINTCDIKKYEEFVANNQIKSDQLYIVDDNDTNRTCVPSLDYLNNKLNNINSIDENCTLKDLFNMMQEIKNAFSK